MLSLRILVWNVGGLNASARQSVVSDVIRDHHVSVVCFQESKFQAVTPTLISQCCGPKFSSFLAVPSVGASGGLILAWDDDVVQIVEVATSQHFILATCTCRAIGQSWVLCNVYGPQGAPAKLNFLSELNTAVSALQAPLVIL